MNKKLRGLGMAVAALCLLAIAASAGAATVFRADFDNGYTLGALDGQPTGHGSGDPYWSPYPDASDGQVVAGVGVGGSNAAQFTWNYSGSPIVASDELILNLTDPGRNADLEFSMDLNFANSEPDYALLVQCRDASESTFATISFGNGYYLRGAGNPYVGLALGSGAQAQFLSVGTFSPNTYHNVVMKVKHDVYTSGLKDTAEVWVDGVQAIAAQRFNVPALGSMDLWVDGASSTAYGPINVDNLLVQSVPEPATLALLSAASLLLSRRRNRL